MKFAFCIPSLMAGTMLAATLPAPAQAQEAGGPPRWSVGAIGLAYRSPYEAENTDAAGGENISYRVFPYVAYRGDRFFIEGQQAGIHLVSTAPTPETGLSLDAVVSMRSPAASSRDKISGDAGGTLAFDSAIGSFSVTALHDVTDVSNGTEISAGYGYTFSGNSFTLTPGVEMIWQDRRMANYVWGTSQRTHDRAIEKGRRIVLPVYEITKSVVNYAASLVFTYNFNNDWTMIAYGSATLLDKTVKRHPGISEDVDATIGIGLARNF